MLYILSFIASIFFLCSSERLDLLKTLPKRDLESQIPLIDEIYVINLDYREEKMKVMEKRLLDYGIIPYRFAAVDGLKVSNRELEIIGSKLPIFRRDGFVKKHPKINSQDSKLLNSADTVFSPDLRSGAVGCYLSHLGILKSAQEAGYEYIWVLEDDVVFFNNPKEIKRYIEELDCYVGKENWDILYTDDIQYPHDCKFYRMDLIDIFSQYLKEDKNKEKPFSYVCNMYEKQKRKGFRHYLSSNRLIYYQMIPKPNGNFRKNTKRHGAYSMIIKKSGIDKILDFYEKRGLFLPYDIEISMIPEINTYNLVQSFTSVETEISDTALN